MARKRQAGRKALLREFYRQIMRHGFALGYAAMGGSYLEGLQIASGPLHSAAIELAANEMAEKELEQVKAMAEGGLVTQPTFALLGEAGPEMVLPLSLGTPVTKKKRKVSKYQRQFGKEMKILKRKHPRTPVSKLMAKGHRATRKALKMPIKRKSRSRR